MLDCIIIGGSEENIDVTMARLKKMSHFSGAYQRMLVNAVQFHGKWMTYMELLNAIIQENSHETSDLNLMDMPNLAVCYLKSFLTRRDLKVDMINFYNKDKDRLAALLQAGARAVTITTTLYAEPDPVQEIIAFIKQQNHEAFIIVGGPFIFNICSEQDATTQEYLFEKIGADVYIYDTQGEQTLAQLLFELRKEKQTDLSSIPNLIYRKKKIARIPQSLEAFEESRQHDHDTAFIRTAREIEKNDLDRNAIDWRLFSKDFLLPTVPIRTARGCAFACAFCQFSLLGGPLTLTGIDSIEAEMKQLHQAGVKYLLFIDDTFNVPLVRFKKILKMMIANKFDFQWVSFFRCSHADNETFDLMQESGCILIHLGIESGDQQILDNMNKHTTVEQYSYGIKQLKKRDILVSSTFIVGFPGETEETVRNTIDFIEENQPTFYRAGAYYHKETFPIHQKAEQFGLRGRAFSWRHNTMDWKDAVRMCGVMYKTIRGSTIFPDGLFDFWSYPYLLGKGLSSEHILTFLKLAQPLLLKNFDAETAETKEFDYSELFALGKIIANELDGCR